MKLALPHLLLAASTALTFVPSPTAQVESSLPDDRFRNELIFDAPFLPVNPTFINILHFMGTVATSNFNDPVGPDTYTVPTYPQVQIVTDRWTQARFLLWGIYLTAIDMVKFGRFHDVVIKLYWENRLVGKMSLIAKPNLKLPSTVRNDTQGMIDDGGEPSLAKMSRNIMPRAVERLRLPPVQNTTTTDIVSVHNSANKSFSKFSILLNAPNQSIPDTPLSSSLSISFVRVAGAIKLKRNNVFPTFYTAILHLARLPAENNMRPFTSRLSTADLRVQMSEIRYGCSNHQAIAALIYVPRYMMEHPWFGYKETLFTIELDGVLACRGTFLED